MYKEIFSERLKKARLDIGISQEKVSETLKIDRSSLSKYETGTAEPSIETLAQLAQFYNVSLNWLLGVVIEKN